MRAALIIGGMVLAYLLGFVIVARILYVRLDAEDPGNADKGIALISAATWPVMVPLLAVSAVGQGVARLIGKMIFRETPRARREREAQELKAAEQALRKWQEDFAESNP